MRQASHCLSVKSLVERRGAKQFANNLAEDQGVVIVSEIFCYDFLRSTTCLSEFYVLKKAKALKLLKTYITIYKVYFVYNKSTPNIL